MAGVEGLGLVIFCSKIGAFHEPWWLPLMLTVRLIPLLLAGVALVGCQSVPQAGPDWSVSTSRPAMVPAESPGAQPVPAVQESADRSWLLQAEMKGLLYAQLKDWRSVRYQLGGMSRKGVDCSAFVYLTFRDRLGIELPRDTRYQSRIGRTVEPSELQPGDLVFFQVDRHTRHVGIYLEDRKFMHVSYQKGVTLSSLDNVYWAKRYWKAVRVPGAMMALARND